MLPELSVRHSDELRADEPSFHESTVIPNEARNLFVACTCSLQATADSSRAKRRSE
jgi:hypothetical protein